ncbi:MAG: class I SAM-dependent methyltransferase [Promethearchaeota archaeon]
MKYDDKKIEDMVKGWYSETAEYEWERLQQDPYHQIEFIVTVHFLEKFLPKNGLILDAGAGPGRYTLELAKRGYDLIILDLTPTMLEIAKKEITQAGLEKRVKGDFTSSIEDLSIFSNEMFDAVLCLGSPLGHIIDAKKREKSIREIIRVAKNQAPIFISVISLIGLLKTILIKFPNNIKHLQHHWKDSNYILGETGKGFAPTHFYLPEELVKDFENHDVEILEIAGLEGLSSHHNKETNEIYKDPDKWNKWIEVLIETCTHPSLIGSSEHFLLVCRKK